MKTTTKLMWLLAAVLILSLNSCKKDKEDAKPLEPAKAKVEFRNAANEINVGMDKMMKIESMQTINYLSELMDSDWGKKIQKTLFQSGKLHLAKVKDNFRLNASGTRDEVEVGDYGIYAYDFDLEEFQLTGASTTQLKLSYPADDKAYALKKNNAELLLDKLEYTTITYTETWYNEWEEIWETEEYEEMVPTNIDLSLKVDGKSQISANYHSTLAENGMPTAVNVSITSAPYQFQMKLSGSGTKYNSSLSLKEGGATVMDYNWDIIYSSDMSNIEKVSGYYIASPLKIKGSLNVAAIEAREELIDDNDNATIEDIDYLNKQMDLELVQTGLNAKIGDIMFKLYNEQGYDYSHAELAVVYSDGTYEWIEDVLDDMGGFRRVRQKR